jgi:hypothetical protein
VRCGGEASSGTAGRRAGGAALPRFRCIVVQLNCVCPRSVLHEQTATAVPPDTARTARRSYGSEQALPCGRGLVAAPSSSPFCGCAPSRAWYRRRTGCVDATRGRRVAGMAREGKKDVK